MSTSPKGLHEAKFWQVEGDRLGCCLCPHHCKIAPGKRGICGVRQNVDGKLYSLIYGKASSVHIDPVEKKPLFHFRPAENILSLGSFGCNLKCLHCQNFSISQARPEEGGSGSMSPEDVSRLAMENGCRNIAFTYNEPTIWHEFTYDACKLAKEKGLGTVYVTNGFIEEEPLREIAPFLDAMNIDVKGFRDDFYTGICKARLDPVLKAAKVAFGLGVHIELTYLIIPTKNDSTEELREYVSWVHSELNDDVPVHFSRFHPDYKMEDVPPTPMRTMQHAQEIAKEVGLNFVYLGNMPSEDGENTVCPKCGTLIIRRHGYLVEKVAYDGGNCPRCGRSLYMVP